MKVIRIKNKFYRFLDWSKVDGIVYAVVQEIEDNRREEKVLVFQVPMPEDTQFFCHTEYREFGRFQPVSD